MAGDIKGITIEIDGKTTKLKTALSDVEKKSKGLNTELKNVNKSLKFNPGNTELLAQKHRILEESIKTTKEKIEKLHEAQKKAAEDLKNGKIGQDEYDALTREVIKAENQLESFQKQMKNIEKESDTVGRKFEEIGAKAKAAGQKMSDAGDKLTKGVTVPIAALSTAAMLAFKEVDNALDTIVTKTGATGRALKGLKDSFNNVYKNIPATADEVGNAIGEVNTQFGLTGKKLEEASEKSIKFAKINGTDVTNSVISGKKILEMYNLEVKNLPEVYDGLTYAAQASGVEMSKLMELTTKSAPQMKTLGLNVAQSAMFLGEIEKSGIDSAKAVAALTKAQVYYAKENKSLSKGLEELKTKFKNAKSEAEKINLASEVFGTKNGPMMAQAISSGALSLEHLADAGKEAKGSLEKTFKDTLDPIDLMKQSLNELKIDGADFAVELQKSLLPIVKGVIVEIRKMTGIWKSLSPEVQQAIIKIMLFSAAAGPMLKVAGGLTKTFGAIATSVPKAKGAVSAFTTALPAMKTGIMALTGPVGICIAALAGLAGIIGIASLNVKHIKTELEKQTEQINKTSKEWDNLKTAQSDYYKTSSEDIDYTQRLYEELKTLTDEQGNVIDKKERAKVIVDELNKLMPGAISWVNDEKIAYKNGAKAIENYIAQKRAEIMIEAQMPLYKKAFLNQEKEEQNLKKAGVQVEKAKAEAKKASMLVETNHSQFAANELKRANKRVKQAEKNYKKQQKLVKDHKDTITKTEAMLLESSKGNYKEVENIYKNGTKAITKNRKDRKKQRDEEVKDVKEAGKKVKKESKKVHKDLEKDIKTEGKKTSKSAKTAFADVGKAIAIGAAKGVKDNKGLLYKEIREMSKQAIKEARKSLDSHSPSREFIKVGQTIPQGMAVGIENDAKLVKNAIVKINESIIKEEEKVNEKLEEVREKYKEREEQIKERQQAASEGKSKAQKEKIANDTKRLQAELKKEAESAEKAIKEELKRVQDFRAEYEKAVAEIESAQESMSKKIVDFGGLFTKTQNEMGRDILQLNNLDSQIADIEYYAENLDKLKKRGLSESLMNEVENMSIEDAISYSEELLRLNEQEFENYIKKWEQKEELSKSIAEKFYKNELLTLKDKFINKIPKELASIKEEMFNLGTESSKSFTKGLNSGLENVNMAGVSIMKSNALSWHDKGGIFKKPAVIGVGEKRPEFVGALDDLEILIKNAMQNVMSSTVGAMQIAMSNSPANQIITVPVNLNGRKIAEAVYDPLKNIAYQKGEK